MMEIPLTRGYVALVDDEDYGRLSQVKWQATPQSNGAVYATRTAIVGGRWKRVLLHRQVMQPKRGKRVAHLDGDGLNNRRENLRIGSGSDIQLYAGKHRRTNGTAPASQFKGVSWQMRDQKWLARIAVKGKRRSLGYYADEESAARAYDEAALTLAGAWARLNFPIDN